MNINANGASVAVNNSATERQSSMSLTAERAALQKNISSIKNVLSDLSRNVTTYKAEIKCNQSLLKSLESVSEKDGMNASVRLKNDHFKYGQARGFFSKILHGDRYQNERKAAVKKINANAEGSTVSAEVAIKELQSRIGRAQTNIGYTEERIESKNNELKLAKSNLVKINVSINESYREGNNLRGKESASSGISSYAKGVSKDIQARDDIQTRKDFSLIYQSNVGCRAINLEVSNLSRGVSLKGSVDAREVIQEYTKTRGDNIFDKNKDVKNTIQTKCKNLSELVKAATIAYYTPADGDIQTFRGQGITQKGLQAIRTQFNDDKAKNRETVYKPGRFFSTSKALNVALGFARSSKDEEKVMFKVIGNSSRWLTVSNGLRFDNNESERLYSPLANFKVTKIYTSSSSGFVTVVLKEVAQDANAKLLPY